MAVRFGTACRHSAASCTAFCKRLLTHPAVGNRNTSGALNNAGTNGNYWSSTQNDSSNAYYMYFNSGNVNTNNNNKTNGRSVRCVRQEFTTLIFLIFDIQTVQSMSPSRVAFCKRLLVHSTTLEFPAVGYRNNSSGSLNNPGTEGDYWSSTQNDSSNAYNMYFNSSNVNTTNNNRRNGFSVRCVRREFTTLIFLITEAH